MPAGGGSSRARWAQRLWPAAGLGQGRDDAAKNRAIYLYRGPTAQAHPRGCAQGTRGRRLHLPEPQDSVPITEAFEKKTGVHVQLWRSAREGSATRSRRGARRPLRMPTFSSQRTRDGGMYREQLLEEFYSPNFADLPAPRSLSNITSRRPVQFLHDRLQTPSSSNRPTCPAATRTSAVPSSPAAMGLESEHVDWSAPW